ncbi:uncharacterized protein LOC119072849 isoform X2 [Bradysia coprophila]|uniref:uncharacterized protein LOC119072849 isoform X2 n=1 Tax=Bradysia coprophila TaxID=38358 RepID=UPI00187DA7CF|nr:uncharacterized protein LOC119072849 isoform X2 [Bradysia coprophila]
MDEQNSIMSPDEEVAMILSSDGDAGPSTSKRTKLMPNSQAGSHRGQGSPSQSRLIGSSRYLWDVSSDSSDSSESSVETSPTVYPTVEAYLMSIPKFDLEEHLRIPIYMELLGANSRKIKTTLPRCSLFTDEEMEVLKNDFILSQLDFLIRENVRRTTKKEEKRKQKREAQRLSSIKKPLPIMPKEHDRTPK